MKQFFAAATLLLLTLLAGCFKQDTSLCIPEDNMFLLFELEAVTRGGEFNSKITSIDVALFDSEGDFVTHKRVEQEDLEEFQGVSLYVTPGLYHVVAWGNVSNCSALSTESSETPTCFSDSYLQTVSSATGCNLYYAPSKEIECPANFDDPVNYEIYQVTVNPGTVTRKQLNFVRVNRRLNVYIRNYTDSDTPYIEISNMPDRYDYSLRTYTTRKNYIQQTSKVSLDGTNEVMEFASFRNPVADFDDTMTVSFLKEGSPSHQTVKAFSLKKFIEDNIDNIPDLLDIQIVFTILPDASITISVPNWEDNQVKPIW